MSFKFWRERYGDHFDYKDADYEDRSISCVCPVSRLGGLVGANGRSATFGRLEHLARHIRHFHGYRRLEFPVPGCKSAVGNWRDHMRVCEEGRN